VKAIGLTAHQIQFNKESFLSMDSNIFAWPDVSSECRRDLKQGIDLMPAAKLLGIQAIGFHPKGVSHIEMLVTPKATFDGRVVQGGIVGVLADFAGISAAACTLPEGWMVGTTSFEIHNIAPAIGTRLIAIGRAVNVGKTIAVSRAEVFAENEGVFNLVCVATTTGRPLEIKK
jgi:uncharacterized protein (TIGR00369 family)